MRWGVLQFPGSCDERDALHACELAGGDARLIWHDERDLGGIDAVVVPGGFSYGDYLRAGAIARFSPVMEAVAAFAATGGPVLGICNGFQVLCEAGLLPGALLLNDELRFVCRQVDLIPADRRRFGPRVTPGRAAVDPDEARRRALLRAGGDARRARSQRAGRLSLRRRAQLQRVGAGHRRGAQRARQRGRADAPSRARGRPVERLDRRAAVLRGRRHGRSGRRERSSSPSTASSASPTPSTS